jgi:hypothetical protein
LKINPVFSNQGLEESQLNMMTNLESSVINSYNAVSGLVLLKEEVIDIKFRKYNPLKGSGYIPLPSSIDNKKATINIKNNDNYCFKYCVDCYLKDIYKRPHPERMTNYKLADNMLESSANYDDLEFPVKIDDITIFEANNKNIGINVYKIVKRDTGMKIDLIRLAKNILVEHEINLLYIEHEDKAHYVFIKNISRLISSQFNKHKESKFICKYCQHVYNTEERYNLSGC